MTAQLAPVVPLNARPTKRRVILADSDAVQRGWLEPVLPSAMAVTGVGTGAQLESELLTGRFDLVIASARLDSDSTLQTLARIRANGDRTPFIVYSSLRESLMRVLVSQVDETLLSSRVLDLDGLASTARMLLDRRPKRD
jgi:DNA-binding response OmpR family regulator